MGLAESPNEVPEPICHHRSPYSWFHLSAAACQSDAVWHIQVLHQPLPHRARGHVPLLPCQLLRLGTLNMLSPSSLFSLLLFFFLLPQAPCEEWFSFNPSVFAPDSFCPAQESRAF